MISIRALIAAGALALAAPAMAQEIVVTGRSLQDTEAALKACIERHCPPDEDVAASLAHAENQFVAGDYDGARRTLHQSLSRNRKHGKQYPVPVSDLLRANSRVAEHMGEAKDFQLSVLDMRDTLRDAYGSDDFRVLVAQIEVGDSRAKLGYPDEAERIYRDVEKRAIAAKQYRVAGFARLRLALMAQVRYEEDPSTYNRKVLDERLGQLINDPLPGNEDFVLAAKVLKARQDRKNGSTASTDALVADFAAKGGASNPILIYAEPIERIDLTADLPGLDQQPRAAWTQWSTQRHGQWIDVGFWVNADGSVSDVEVLRSSGKVDWAKPVLGSISRRIYAPLRKDGDTSPGFYMVERYTLTARVTTDATGTHLRTREAKPRIEMMSLTPDAPPAKTASN